VTAVSLPKGMTVDFQTTTAPAAAVNAPPMTFALSRLGSLAAIVHPETPGTEEDAQLLVIRADGTHVSLTKPPDAVLSEVFAHATIGPHHEPSYSSARFLSVALANDGTPFATVGLPFSGAFSGIDEGVFVWNGARWRDALRDSTSPIDTTNVTIAAADAPSRFVCNANYFNTFANLDSAERDPHYQENQTLLFDGHRTLPLGYGMATAMYGRFVVGYTAGVRSVHPSAAYPTVALEWTDGHRASLGSGIAYGVNAQGDAVGDNEPALGAVGAPTLWHRGHAIQLSERFGSAYAVAENGNIVGRIGDSAFIIRGGDVARKVTRIDELVREHGWHVTAAYAIAANGRILATGQRGSNPPRILLLKPVSD